uniref:Uncharacterized protein n=1 Tax=Rhizophora mucronata TaxID=61149 RepID=A0A2P2N564_RHIMU
MIFNWDIAKI